MIAPMILRRFARLLPARLLQAVKKIYYPHLLRAITPADEIDIKVVTFLVSAGDYVIDIGANIGVYTKFLSELVGLTGRVYSIEPVPLTYDILVSNVGKLGLANVKTIECAISDEDGVVQIEVPKDERGENFYRAKVVTSSHTEAHVRRFSVESRCLDSLFRDSAQRITFVKCDVEGHELSCIKGATGFIKKHMPAWLIELSENLDVRGSTAHKISQLLTKRGYQVYWFDGMNLNRWQPGDESVNYWFLTPDHVQALQSSGLCVC